MKNAVTAALLLSVLCLLAAPGPTVAGETIGVVRTVSGDATITAGKTRSRPPRVETPGRGHPRHRSGRVARRHPPDDSSLSIGPESRLVLQSFHFSPYEGKFDLAARITQGTMAYLSGLIGKLAPQKAASKPPRPPSASGERASP